MAKIHLFIMSFRVKLDREAYLIMARFYQGFHMLFAQVFNLDALSSCSENICFLDFLEIIVGYNSMFKLTLSDNQDQTIGIQIDLLEKIH